jgi:hypothetical protein
MAEPQGTIEVHELSDRVRYVLPARPWRACALELLKNSGFMAIFDVIYLFGIWSLIHGDIFSDTLAWQTVKVVAVLVLAVSMAFTSFCWIVILWIVLLESLGKRAEVQLFPTALRCAETKGWAEKINVFAVNQIDRFEVRSSSGFILGNRSGIFCEVANRFYPLVWRDVSRPMMIELAHGLGRRTNRPVAVREPDYD